jgi:hypothetical protein
VKAEFYLFGRIALDPLTDNQDPFIGLLRAAICAGELKLPLDLGLSSPVRHIERGQRDCYDQAIETITTLVGPAARVIDCGYFASTKLDYFLSQLERPKAGIVLAATPDLRSSAQAFQSSHTAQVSVVHANACQGRWPLEPMAAGRTLVVLSGGGFGLLPPKNAFDVLENASAALSMGDFILITLEQPRDVAELEAAYLEHGQQIVMQALSKLGRVEGLTPRVFCEAHAKNVRLGAVAEAGAQISWNGTICALGAGSFIDFGSIHITGASTTAELHPDFEVAEHWESSDHIVSLLLLRRI